MKASNIFGINSVLLKKSSTARLAVGLITVVTVFGTLSLVRIESARVDSGTKKAQQYGRPGISFEQNRGQADAQAKYLARLGGKTVFLTDNAVWFVNRVRVDVNTNAENPRETVSRTSAVKMEIEGASAQTRLVAERGLGGRTNYFRGNDPAKWITDVPTFGAVRYSQVYTGVDLILYENERAELEYDFRLSPGADSNQIRLKFSGAERLDIDAEGNLQIKTVAGTIQQSKPIAYQENNGVRTPVETFFDLSEGGRVSFLIGEYNRDLPLTIDPSISYGTYIGGGGFDEGNDIAVDPAGNAYITGRCDDVGFPVTPGAYDTTYNTGNGDAFVTKLNPTGTAAIYSTFLGGTSLDYGTKIAVDSTGSAYVGISGSPDFPLTGGSFQMPSGEMYLVKLNPAGSGLVYSSRLGGSANLVEEIRGVAVDSDGNLYATGETYSTDFPTTPGAYDTTTTGVNSDAFITKLNGTGSALIYSTFLGGTDTERGYDLAIDPGCTPSTNCNAYVTGRTFSTNFPTTAGAYDTSRGGTNDTYVTKINATGSALVYSSYLGGGFTEEVRGIAVDSSGNAYVGGYTTSSDFPTTPGSFDTQYGGGPVGSDAFVTKFNASGTGLSYSTFLGSQLLAPDDQIFGIAVDSSGRAYVTGNSDGIDFPLSDDAFDNTLENDNSDAFVTQLNNTGSGIVFSSFIGGANSEIGRGVVLDPSGNAYIAGITDSGNFPTTPGAFDTTSSSTDAFAIKISFAQAPTPTPSVSPSPSGSSGGTPDATFGTGGIVTTDFSNSYDYATSVAIQSDGKIVVAGESSGTTTPITFALARYNPNGSLDTTFGTNGRVTTAFPGTNCGASGVVIQPDGKIIAAGNRELNTPATNYDFALARYNPDGSLDTSFGSGGLVTTELRPGSNDSGQAIALHSDGKIVVAGDSWGPGTTEINLAGKAQCDDAVAVECRIERAVAVVPHEGPIASADTRCVTRTNDFIVRLELYGDNRISLTGNLGTNHPIAIECRVERTVVIKSGG